jgi:hypothetical protein
MLTEKYAALQKIERLNLRQKHIIWRRYHLAFFLINMP